jgi:CPA2 family monovalent cation:H+ antiporter-2
MIGDGRVGRVLAARLAVAAIEHDEGIAEQLRAAGIPVVLGNAADPEVLAAVRLGAAKLLFVAIPDAFEAGQVIEQARAANPALRIIARAHGEAEAAHLLSHGASAAVQAEQAAAEAMWALWSGVARQPLEPAGAAAGSLTVAAPAAPR